MAESGDAATLQLRVRSWLRPELLDAQESRRTWRLRCIQAEAEKRNLLAQASSGALSPGSGSPASASRLRSPSTVSGNSSPTALTGLSPQESSFGSPASLAAEVEVETALAKVLALERHIADMTMLIASVEADTETIRENTANVEACLPDRRAAAEEAAQQAAIASSNALSIAMDQSTARDEHEKKCEWLVNEVLSLQAYAQPQDDVEAELEIVEGHRRQLAAIVAVCEEDIDEVARRRECLWMSREQAITRRRDFVDSHAQSTREAAAAKHSAQARATALSRLQGEVLRTRSKSERKRRLLEGQLVNCRSELTEAAGRVSTAGEKLRKLKQQQGKQLRELRTDTQGLQSEVDEHLLAIENSEANTNALHNEEAELANDRHRHLYEEQALEERNLGLRRDALRLEHEVSAQEATGQLSLAHMRRAEEEYAEEELKTEALQAEVQSIRLSTEAAEATAQQLKGEQREEQQLCGMKAQEQEKLEALELKASDLKAKNEELTAEHLQLQESVKRALKDSEKHISEMQEASRRTSRLKAQHKELVEPASSRGREALVGVMDQALGRVNKKAEAVIACLESFGPASAGNRSARPSAQTASLLQKSQEALQRRLQAEYERSMETLLAEERRKVVLEQQRSLTEARRRSGELQKTRQEGRRLQEELVRCQQAYEWARRSSQSELLGLEAQVKLVDSEATDGAEAVTAEFSDLLQKQALARDVLQAQVEELRGVVDGGSLKSQDESEIMNEDDGADLLPGLPTAVLLQRLALEEAEADSLRAEEEELLHTHVKLKAALVASRGTKATPTMQARSLSQDGSVQLQPLSDAGNIPDKKPVTLGLLARASARVAQPPSRRSRSPADPPAHAASSSGASGLRPHERAVTLPSYTTSPFIGHLFEVGGRSISSEPKTPPKSVWREGMPIVTADVQEDVDAGSEVVTSQNPVPSNSPLQTHRQLQQQQRVASAMSSLSVAGGTQIGAPLSGSPRSASVSTSGSTPNLPSAFNVLGGVRQDLGQGLPSFSSGAVCTWPSGMHIPSQQDTMTKDAVDPRTRSNLGSWS